MRIGVPTEIKARETRVALTPAGARELTTLGHSVVVQDGAGEGVGFRTSAYREAGAEIVETAGEVFDEAELIVKVKEPQKSEYAQLKRGQTLFTYLHLAADPEQTAGLVNSGATAIAYETVTDDANRLPLLQPMSEIAGRMAVQVGAMCLEQPHGGRGILLSGAPGVKPADVVILGGGTAGLNALQIALGNRARITLFETSLPRLKELDLLFGDRVTFRYSTHEAIAAAVRQADLVIGTVLIPGASAPRLITRADLSEMRDGAVIVDVAIDQGGCVETARPTTHDDPTFIIDNVVHYCVANMPGAVARTSTEALTNATIGYIVKLATLGVDTALAQDRHLMAGVNVREGDVVHPAIRQELAKAA